MVWCQTLRLSLPDCFRRETLTKGNDSSDGASEMANLPAISIVGSPAHARPVGPPSRGLRSAWSSPAWNALAPFANGTLTRRARDSSPRMCDEMHGGFGLEP